MTWPDGSEDPVAAIFRKNARFCPVVELIGLDLLHFSLRYCRFWIFIDYGGVCHFQLLLGNTCDRVGPLLLIGSGHILFTNPSVNDVFGFCDIAVQAGVTRV